MGTAGLALAGWSAFAPIQKKFIAHGWDLLDVTPEEVLAHADAFDRTALDGVTLMVNDTLADGRQISHMRVMNDPPWPRDQLQGKIKTFQEIVKHPSLRESFISSWWAPQKRLAWTDDAAWANFATNMATVAWLAKQGGLRGILVDGEDYPQTEQYRRLAGDPSYDETAALARKRGAEVFGAIFKEYPDVTFLSFWLLSQNVADFSAPEPIVAAKARGDLWVWFLNGMLDVMPAGAKFVDGNECAYHYEAEKQDFFRSASELHTAALGLVAPENRRKYRAQACAGSGHYLDAYINPTNSPWYFGPRDGSRLNHFRANLVQATAAADEYLWIYGEQKAWIKWTNLKKKRFEGAPTWDDVLPGFTDMMLGVKDPRRFLNRRLADLRATGRLENLAKINPEPWQAENKPRGTYGRDGTALYLKDVSNGCYLVYVEGKPGDLFAISLKHKGVGGSAVIYWQKDHAWQWGIPAVTVPIDDGDAAAWRSGGTVVRIPEGADAIGLQLSAHQVKGETCWYDAVEVYRLEK